MKRASLLIMGLLMMIQACTYDSEEELYGEVDCKTENVSYVADVVPILQNNGCLGCHNAADAQGGIVIDSYETLKIWIENERFLGSIRHDAGFSAMPKGAPKINQCSIDKITAWISDGYPNN
jgi:hypothetical protein